ncbi:bifunctional DNA primase/helicase [Aquimarina addita]|uniref:Bifunctional DNA primase/helicase n=1 Tax=Aquimarina addita TaxID=870485 RepID=A0ABP6UTQ6_9FLAO
MEPNNNITKENIIKRIDSQTLLNYYLQPYHAKGRLQQGKHISNPFLSEKQKTPSFNIYKSTSGIWRYKDFADSDCEGDVFDLIMKLKHCSFPEALQHINTDFNLGLQEYMIKKKPEIQLHTAWTEELARYWKAYGILPVHLKYFYVFPVAKITRYNENNEPYHIHSNNHNPIFAYRVSNTCYKIYRPLAKSFKFSWIGDKPENYVFGYSKLPESGKQLFITGGEKDVLSLSVKGYHAVCFNSETSLPHVELMQELKERFKRVTILYDMDQTGIAQSEKIATTFGVYRASLPQLNAKGGKDISDFFQLGCLFSKETIKMIPPSQKKEVVNDSKYLAALKQTQQVLKETMAKDIVEIPTLLSHKDEGVIFSQSINIIQGKSGTHKSRLAQTICSAFLKKENCNNELLAFTRNPDKPCFVCYVDTERNLANQFPKALQEIQVDAGYDITEDPRNFAYTSLVNTKRSDRYKALCDFIIYVQKDVQKEEHLIIVLDVVSDCIMDFNNTQNSLDLIDMLNTTINKQDVTFIAVIHENPHPNDKKARGHLGSEMLNKSTVTFRMAFENEKQETPDDLIVIHFPKNRNGKKPKPSHIEFCEATKRLVLASNDRIKQVQSVKNNKGNLGEIIEFLSSYVTGVVSGKTMVADLCQTFSCGNRTMRERLKELCSNYYEIPDANNVPCSLVKTQKGREVFYQLEKIENPVSGMKAS